MLHVSALNELLQGHILTIDVALDNRPASSEYQRILDEVRDHVGTVRQISSLRTSRPDAPVKRPSFRIASSKSPRSFTYDGPADSDAIVNFLVNSLRLQDDAILGELSC